MSKLDKELTHYFTDVAQQPASRRSVAAAASTFGFTIVEILIVIVVIGILASIVIVAYNGISSRAKETSIKADLAGIAKKMGVYYAQNGIYPTYTASDLDTVGMKINHSNYVSGRNNVYYCRSNDMLHYAVGVDTSNDTEYFVIDGTTNLVANGSVDGAKTCAYLTTNGFTAPSTGGPSAYAWNTTTSTGTWQSWMQ